MRSPHPTLGTLPSTTPRPVSALPVPCPAPVDLGTCQVHVQGAHECCGLQTNLGLPESTGAKHGSWGGALLPPALCTQ